jgi:hypothetical protein
MKELIDFDNEYSEFEDSVCSMIGQEEEAARTNFAIKIQEMIDKYPDCADLYHKLGLCYFNLSYWKDEHKDIIELAFHRALIFDPRSIFSIMFLVFFYFDIGKYHLSLCFNRMLTQLDVSNIPKWRFPKLEGLEITCLIYLRTTNSLDLECRIETLLNKYKDLDEDELDGAEPNELILALEKSEFIRDSAIKIKVAELKQLCL